MAARRFGKEETAVLLQTALAEVMQLVGFALPYKDEREPAAALAAPAADAGIGGYVLRFHSGILLDRNMRKDNGLADVFRILTGIGGINGIQARSGKDREDQETLRIPFREPRYPSAGFRHMNGGPGPRPHSERTP